MRAWNDVQRSIQKKRITLLIEACNELAATFGLSHFAVQERTVRAFVNDGQISGWETMASVLEQKLERVQTLVDLADESIAAARK